MRAALYVRVSTMEQATEGYSVGVQKEKLAHFAVAQNYTIVDTYSDEGFSGKTLVRPAVDAMINAVKAGKIDIVLIYKLDRLSRHVKDVLELVELFEKYKVALYSLNENLDLSSPFGRAALKMSATFSELERETIVERMTMGKTARSKSGRYSCPGPNCPFGYRHDKANDRFLVDETEAEIVRKLFDLYVNQGYTFRKLRNFAQQAYPDFKKFTSNDLLCCKPIIERPLYAGYFMHKGTLIKGTNFEPIIAYETYLQAQARVQTNKSMRSKDNAPYLLSGLLLCARCGNRYVGRIYDRYNLKKDGTQTKHHKYRCYGCAARVKRDKRYTPVLCDNNIFHVEDMDPVVEKAIKQLDIESIGTEAFVPGFVDTLMTEITVLEEKRNKLLDLYLDNVIDKDAYALRLVDIEAKINENKMVIDTERNRIQDEPTESFEIIKEKLANYDGLPANQKRQLLQGLIKYIAVDGDDIKITYRFKT